MIRQLKFDTIGYVTEGYMDIQFHQPKRLILQEREVKYSFGVKDTYSLDYFIYEECTSVEITKFIEYKPWYLFGGTKFREVISWESSASTYYHAVRIEADNIKSTLILGEVTE